MKTHIEFPVLGIDLTMNRRLVEFDALGGGIYYYAVIICLGFLLAWFFVTKREKKAKNPTEPISDMVLSSATI